MCAPLCGCECVCAPRPHRSAGLVVKVCGCAAGFVKGECLCLERVRDSLPSIPFALFCRWISILSFGLQILFTELYSHARHTSTHNTMRYDTIRYGITANAKPNNQRNNHPYTHMYTHKHTHTLKHLVLSLSMSKTHLTHTETHSLVLARNEYTPTHPRRHTSTQAHKHTLTARHLQIEVTLECFFSCEPANHAEKRLRSLPPLSLLLLFSLPCACACACALPFSGLRSTSLRMSRRTQ